MSARLSAIVVLAATFSAASAHAQSPSTSQRALTLGYEADGLFARGRWSEAYERFAEADQLAHSPVFVLYMARCRKNAGRLVEARSLYERAAHETLAPDAPKPFREATTDAAAERDEVARRIPTVRLVVTGAQGAVTVTIDGEVVSARTDVIELDPGTHEVKASSADLGVHKTVTVAEGARAVPVELVLSRAPGAKEPPPETQSGSLAPALVALSLGVVGVGVGAVAGALAAGKTNDVKPSYIDGHCRVQDGDELDAARTLATVSTIGFIAGGAALALGGVLLIVRPGGGPSGPATAWIGVRGAF